MAEIKWTNVDGAALNGAVSNSQSAVNAFTAQLNQLGSNTKDFTTELQQRADETAEWNRSQNTQRIVNQMLNADSLEALQQMQAEGVGDAQTALSQYGGQIDLAALNKSKATWVADTQNRALAKDSLRDYTDIAQKRRAEILNLANNGGEAEALKLLNASGDIFSNKTLGELQATISGRIDANRRFLLDSRLATVQEKTTDSTAKANESIIATNNANAAKTTIENNEKNAEIAKKQLQDAGALEADYLKLEQAKENATNTYGKAVLNVFGEALREATQVANKYNTHDQLEKINEAIKLGDINGIVTAFDNFNSTNGTKFKFDSRELQAFQTATDNYNKQQNEFKSQEIDLNTRAKVLSAIPEAHNRNTVDDHSESKSSQVSYKESNQAHQAMNAGSEQGSYTRKINKEESQTQNTKASVNGIGVSSDINQTDRKYSKTEVTQTGAGTTTENGNNTDSGTSTSLSTSEKTTNETYDRKNKVDFSDSNKILDDIKNNTGKSILSPEDIKSSVLSFVVDSSKGYTKKPNIDDSEYVSELRKGHELLLKGRAEALQNGDTKLVEQFDAHLAQLTGELSEAEKQQNEIKIQSSKGKVTAEQIVSDVQQNPANIAKYIDNSEKNYDANHDSSTQVGDQPDTSETDAIEVENLRAIAGKYESLAQVTDAIQNLMNKQITASIEERAEIQKEISNLSLIEQYIKDNPGFSPKEIGEKIISDHAANNKAILSKNKEKVLSRLGINNADNFTKEFVNSVSEDELSPSNSAQDDSEKEAQKKLKLTIPTSATNGSGNYVIDIAKDLAPQLKDNISGVSLGTSDSFTFNAKLDWITNVAEKIDKLATDPNKRETVLKLREFYASKLMPILSQLSSTDASSDGNKKYIKARTDLKKLNQDFNVLLNTTSTTTIERIKEEANSVKSQVGAGLSFTNHMTALHKAVEERRINAKENNGKAKISLLKDVSQRYESDFQSKFTKLEDKFNFSPEFKSMRDAQAQLNSNSNKTIEFLSSVSDEKLKSINAKISEAIDDEDYTAVAKLNEQKQNILANIAEQLPKTDINALNAEISYLTDLNKKGINVEENNKRIATLKKYIASYARLRSESDAAHAAM